MSIHINAMFDETPTYLRGGDEGVFNEAMDQLEKKLSSAICFDAGDLTNFETVKTIRELVRLPYSVVWIEGSVKIQNGEMNIASMCYEIDGEVYGVSFFRIAKTDSRWVFWFSWKNCSDGTTDVFGADSFNQRHGFFYERESVLIPVVAVTRFLSALNCTNINSIEHKPSEKLQKARAKRGKQPLFSYWTLEIDLPKSRAAGEDYGGTHASPRLHLRRGHPRQYAPGKYCWVQPCVVGNKAAGMVHKDYAIKHAA